MKLFRFYVRLLGAAALLVASISTHAQSLVPEVADCAMVGLEASPRIFEAPGDMHVVAVEYRNLTVAPCRLHRYGLKEPYVQLNPGATAHASFRWKIRADTGAACREQPFATINVNIGLQGMQWNPGGLALAGPLLLPPACSEPNGDSVYAPGTFVPDWTETKPASPVHTPTVTLAAVPLEYYGASRYFDVTISNFDNALPLGKNGCPIILSEWTISGFLRFEERDVQQCRPAINSSNPLPASATMRLKETDGSPGGLGSRVSRFAAFLGYSAQGEMLFAHSNPVTLERGWPPSETLVRHWGPEQRGVRASLTLDKTHYEVGEDIPLHIFFEETASDRPLYGEPFRRRAAFRASPAGSMSLEIRSGAGPVPRSGESGNLLYPSGGGSSGSFVCPQPLKDGKEDRIDRSLKHVALLPDTPGTYTLAVRWSVYASDQTDCPTWSDTPRHEPFVTVTSQPVTVTIDPPTPQPAAGQDSYYVPRSQFDNVGVAYTRAGKTPLELREVWVLTPGYKETRHLSLLVMFEPVTRAFSWRAMWSPGSWEGRWQSDQAKDREAVFLKDGELTDFRPIDMTIFVHANRSRAANMNEAVTKSLKAASESLDPLKDMDKEQGVHMVFLTTLDRDFTARPMTSAPAGVTSKVLDVQWDGTYWTLLLEARWKAKVVLDADYNVVSATKVE